MQFEPHKGRQGYWFYPTARAQARNTMESWADAIDKAFEQWNYKAR